MRDKKNDRLLQIRIPTKLWEKIRRIAEDKNMSISDYVRQMASLEVQGMELIEDYLLVTDNIIKKILEHESIKEVDKQHEIEFLKNITANSAAIESFLKKLESLNAILSEQFNRISDLSENTTILLNYMFNRNVQGIKKIIEREISKNVPFKIDDSDFNENILKRINNEDDINFIKSVYEKNKSKKCYSLNNYLQSGTIQKISSILKSIDYNKKQPNTKEETKEE